MHNCEYLPYYRLLLVGGRAYCLPFVAVLGMRLSKDGRM